EARVKRQSQLKRSGRWYAQLWCCLAVLCGACMAHGASARQPSANALHALIDREWQWRLHRVPVRARADGGHAAYGDGGQVDTKTQLRHLEHWRAIAAELAALPTAELSSADRVSAAVLAEQIRERISGIERGAYLMPINGDSGFFVGAANLPRLHTFRTV